MGERGSGTLELVRRYFWKPPRAHVSAALPDDARLAVWAAVAVGWILTAVWSFAIAAWVRVGGPDEHVPATDLET